MLLIFTFFFSSSLVLRVLSEAHKSGIKFRVIVIDGRPRMEGIYILKHEKLVEIDSLHYSPIFIYLLKII